MSCVVNDTCTAASNARFKVGDVVCLKSGGPRMTVNGVFPHPDGTAKVSVEWFHPEGMCVDSFRNVLRTYNSCTQREAFQEVALCHAAPFGPSESL